MFITYKLEKLLVVSGAGIDSGSTNAGSNRRHNFPGLKGVHIYDLLQLLGRWNYMCSCILVHKLSCFCLTVCVDDKYLRISSDCGRSLVIHLFMMPCAGETSRTSVEALVRTNFPNYFLNISHGTN